MAAAAQCRETPTGLAPTIDRSRCEGKAQCARVCPYGVFEVRALAPEDRAALSLMGRLKAWAHGGKQAYVVNPGACRACRLCVESCPEQALELKPWPPQ